MRKTYRAERINNPRTERDRALGFLQGVRDGVLTWRDFGDYENLYGRCEGFVYFVGIGEPRFTHIKIGFTAGSPHSRMKSLQTGCPFKIRMGAFILGQKSYETELHDVLKEYKCEGEWFTCSEYVQSVITNQLFAEAF